MRILAIREDCWIWLELPKVTKTRFTNAETSWRRESVWKYEVMFEGGLEERDEQEKQRTAKTAAVLLPLWQR